jgi:hypothetical protein
MSEDSKQIIDILIRGMKLMVRLLEKLRKGEVTE